MSASRARPRVSVVMTAYNQSEYIPEAVDSVLSQDYSDLEIVFVDDGSSEDLAPVVAPYRDKLTYIRRDNGGLAAARNTGWRAARGEYVAFCDADDIHFSFRVPAHAALLDRFPEAAQVYSDLAMYVDGEVTSETTLRGRDLGPVLKEFDEAVEEAYGAWSTAADHGVPVPEQYADRRVYCGRVPHLISTYHIAWGGASMYRRAALVAVGGHDERMRRWPDWYLASRLSKSFQQIYLDVPVLKYRQHGGQLTKRAALGAKSYRDIVYSVWRNDPVFRAQHRAILSRIVQRASATHAHYQIKAGEWDEAREHLRDYIRERPLGRIGYTAYARTIVMDKLISRFRKS